MLFSYQSFITEKKVIESLTTFHNVVPKKCDLFNSFSDNFPNFYCNQILMDIMISKFGQMDARIRMLQEEIKHETKNVKEQLKINNRTLYRDRDKPG